MVTSTENGTELSELIQEKMEAKGFNINSLAAAVDITYEHMRGIVRGIRLPSKHVLKDLARVLEVDYEDLQKVATVERIKHHYGDGVAALMGGKKDGIEPIERVWDKLSDDQQATLIDMAKSMAKRSAKR